MLKLQKFEETNPALNFTRSTFCTSCTVIREASTGAVGIRTNTPLGRPRLGWCKPAPPAPEPPRAGGPARAPGVQRDARLSPTVTSGGGTSGFALVPVSTLSQCR